MKRIIRWLETKLSRPKSPDTSDVPSDSESAKPDEIDLGIDLPKGLQEPAKNVLMPDIYGAEHDATVPHLKIPDQPSLEVGESAGFNPYDTAKMDKK